MTRFYRRFYLKHIVRRWHAWRGHRFVQDDIVKSIALCRCGNSKLLPSDDRFITRTRFEDGYEVTSYYDKRSGLITETRTLHKPRTCSSRS